MYAKVIRCPLTISFVVLCCCHLLSSAGVMCCPLLISSVVLCWCHLLSTCDVIMSSTSLPSPTFPTDHKSPLPELILRRERTDQTGDLSACLIPTFPLYAWVCLHLSLPALLPPLSHAYLPVVLSVCMCVLFPAFPSINLPDHFSVVAFHFPIPFNSSISVEAATALAGDRSSPSLLHTLP